MYTRRSIRAFALAAAALLAVPVAASWGNDPIDEPSSKYDLPKYMWQTPNDRTQRVGGVMQDRLYFNAQLSVNEEIPAPQAPGGRMPFAVLVSAEALLGYWRDCNNDGYIGNRLTGQTKYLAQTTTVDTQVCPPGTAFNPGHSISQGVYSNVRPMVYEFIAVGDERTYLSSAPVVYSIDDDDARVWGDFGRPDQKAVDTPATYPLPSDFWDSWNAHISYVDSLTYRRASTAARDGAGVDVYKTPLAGNNPATPLKKVRNAYAQESPENPEGRPLVKVWECRSSRTDDVVLRPGVDPEGSVFDSTNNTVKGLMVTAPGSPLGPSKRYDVGQGCDGPANGGVLADGLGRPVTTERPELVNSERKTTTDWVFIHVPPFQEPRHQVMPWTGIRHNSATGAWFSRDPQLIDVADLRNAHYFTFYAKVGQAGLTGSNRVAPHFSGPGVTALPGAVYDPIQNRWFPPSFVYGREACTSPHTGYNGWDCSAWPAPSSTWLANAAPHWGVTLGETYQLRDTDCLDLTVALGRDSNRAKDTLNGAWYTVMSRLFNPIPPQVGDKAFHSYCE